MVDVNWSFHPLEGIVLAAVLFALYYWIIRLRCHARKAQAFIFTAVLAVSLCSFTSLSVVLDTDKPIHANRNLPYGQSMVQHPVTSVFQPPDMALCRWRRCCCDQYFCTNNMVLADAERKHSRNGRRERCKHILHTMCNPLLVFQKCVFAFQTRRRCQAVCLDT